MTERHLLFDWDDTKAANNLRKHDVSFDVAATVFNDPNLLTVADLELSELEERWFSIGWASNGSMLVVCYVWNESPDLLTKVRIISARLATRSEKARYKEGL